MSTSLIPKGKDIITILGCKCKNEYVHHGKTYKETCTVIGNTQPLCHTDKDCGRFEEGENHRWDYCSDRRSTFLDENTKYGKGYWKRNISGLLIYIAVFVITVPTILYKFGFKNILEVYLPNLDLLARAISFNNGPIGLPIFAELYDRKANSLLGYLSALFINYASLLGLTYLISRRVKLTKSLLKGWGIGFIMLIFTYLLPNEMIAHVQNKLGDYLFAGMPSEHYNLARTDPFNPKVIHMLFYYLVIVVVGLSVAGLFIMVEKFLLATHETWLIPLLKKVFSADRILGI